MKDSGNPGDSDFPRTKNQTRSNSEDETQPERSSGRRAAKPTMFWTYAKWTAATGTCLAAMTIGVLGGRLYFGNSFIRRIVTSAFMNPGRVLWTRDALADYTVQNKLPADKQQVINVLLLGCDRDYVGKRVHGVAVAVPLMNTNGRSDAILIARFDFARNKVSLLSIPRDTEVHIPQHGISKINAAYALGGPELTKQTIKDVFGIDTDFYVALHFEAFEKLVDALGGVDVDVHKVLDYDDNWANLHVHLHPGPQHLNGYKAMGYVRIRHSDSDIMRAERQHEFLEALRNKVKSPSILWSGAKALGAVTNNIKSDLNQDELITLAKWSSQVPKEQITLATLPSIEGPSYVYIRVKESQKVISDLFFDGEQEVAIQAPAREVASNSTARGRRKKRGHVHAADAAADGVTPGPDGAMANPVSPDDNPMNPDDPPATDGDGAAPTPTPDKPATDDKGGSPKSGGDGAADGKTGGAADPSIHGTGAAGSA